MKTNPELKEMFEAEFTGFIKKQNLMVELETKS